MDWPLVTVFTLIYNTNPRYVIEAIESVRANKYPNLQHIIIDDCSPNPEPKEKVKQWIKDNNYSCEFHEHSVNYGLCKTLNHVLRLANGKYIFGCSDDLIPKNRIWKDVEVFSNLDDNYALVYSLSQVIDKYSARQPRVFPSLAIPEGENYWEKLINSNCLSAPGTTYRVSTLKKIGGFNEQIKFEDYEINLRFASLGYKFKCIPEILSFYRIHDDSVSSRLNFELEDIRILALFHDNVDVKNKLYEKTWNLIYNKRLDAESALEVYEDVYHISWKLRFALNIKSKIILRLLNRIFRLDQVG